jgi:hypothetical protein
MIFAFLPTGWGRQVADAEETVQRQRLKDGEYLLLHKSIFRKSTQAGDAIIIEHEIIESKKTAPDVEPMSAGTNWGYFMPEYGKAKVMLLPNMKAYVLGLLGLDSKKVSKEALADTIDAISDERQAARGMLVKGVTFHTVTDEEKDFVGMNWYPVPGENVLGSPNVLKRRAELDAKGPAGVPSNGAAAGASAPPPPAPGTPPPPPSTGDPLAPFVAQGWKQHPTAPDFMWMPTTNAVKSKVDLIAGR